jgi:hypothetical protein
LLLFVLLLLLLLLQSSILLPSPFLLVPAAHVHRRVVYCQLHRMANLVLRPATATTSGYSAGNAWAQTFAVCQRYRLSHESCH